METPSKIDVLIPEVKLQSRVRELAMQINQEFNGEPVVAVCTLKGSFVFFADLIRELDLDVTCEFLGLSSYGDGTVSSGEVRCTLDINTPLEGKHVLVVEDIVDSGLTLRYIQEMLTARRPASLKTCALLVKPDSLKVPTEVDYTGFEIGDEFVIGYGLDYAQKYRGLKYIGYIHKEH